MIRLNARTLQALGVAGLAGALFCTGCARRMKTTSTAATPPSNAPVATPIAQPTQAPTTPVTPPSTPPANLPVATAEFQPVGGPEPAADLYGDQDGEEVLPAGQAPKDAPLRARKDDTFFRLSNPRLGRSRFGMQALLVDYEKVQEGKHGGASLIIRDEKGNTRTVMLLGPFWQKSGTIEIDQRGPSFGRSAFPVNAELYLHRSEHRYGFQNQPRFKVSNSAVLGSMPSLTLARSWTAEEADKLTKPPPNFANPNAHANVGHDTPFAGDTTGGGLLRYVDPEKPLLGLEYRVANWENESCLGQLVAVFTRDQPSTFQPRVIAPEGYAVGGMNVQTKRFVDAVQLIYMKVLPDGTLDPKDSKTSDWLGPASQDAKTTKLGGDGRKVIGIHNRQGAILNGVALVMDKSGVK